MHRRSRQTPSSSRRNPRGCIESFKSASEATRRSWASVAAVRLSPRGPVEGLAHREEILEDTSRDSSARAKRPDGPRQRPSSSRKKSRGCIESFDSPSEATRRSGTSVAAVRPSPRGPVEGLARREEILEDASRVSSARAKLYDGHVLVSPAVPTRRRGPNRGLFHRSGDRADPSKTNVG